jgi:Na+-translocating ferredoxin:NAD+ oxidoreductase RnfE subunit
MVNQVPPDQDKLIVDEILLFFQEKRTILMTIRMAIGTIMVQVSILSFLIVTSRFYQLVEVMHLVVPFIVLNAIVLGVAGYFLVGSLIQLHRLERQIVRYKRGHSRIAACMDKGAR